jgi:hypothetical protein
MLRACIVNIHTDRRDIELLTDIVTRTGRVIDGELRKIPESTGL